MKRKCKKWTDADYEVLKQCYELSDKEIAEKLDRTLKAVIQKRKDCGLLRSRGIKNKYNLNSFTLWTDKERQILIDNLDKSDAELSGLIGRSAGACRNQRITLGYKNKRGRKLGTVIKDTSPYRVNKKRKARDKEIKQLNEGKKLSFSKR